MKEFMFFIRKQADSKETLSPVKHTEFLKSCQTYIETLKTQGRLISAQPIERSGEILSFSEGAWDNTPFNEPKEVIAGYYHILAENLDEAISTAMKNPEFEYNPGTRIEVRPIKMKEEATGFVYPAK
jgi:hypothetical protein